MAADTTSLAPIVTRLVDLAIPTPTFGDHANTYLRVAFRLFRDDQAGDAKGDTINPRAGVRWTVLAAREEIRPK